MHETTRTARIVLTDGRIAAVDLRGPQAGPPVLLLTPAPGSRAFDPDAESTRRAGVRLVTLDRPGYGLTSPLPDGITPTWARQADEMFDALTCLGLERLDVIGWSNGGIAALALAAMHPQIVRSVALVGTPAPDELVPWVPDAFRPALAVLRETPEHAVAQLAPSLEPVAADRDAALVSVGADPGNREQRAALAPMLDMAFRQGGLGMATDIVCTHVAPWGFDPSSVRAPVSLWYGEDDRIIPPAHGAYWQRQLGALLRIVPGADHLLTRALWRRILAARGDALLPARDRPGTLRPVAELSRRAP
jgi:pimeloyl-ACP methyl ester carboxylesterase